MHQIQQRVTLFQLKQLHQYHCDLREKEPFKRKHIDGARNLPYTMLKYQYTELRETSALVFFVNIL